MFLINGSTGKGLNPELNLAIFDNVTISEHETLQFSIDIQKSLPFYDHVLPLKVTIAWYDPASSAGTTKHTHTYSLMD